MSPRGAAQARNACREEQRARLASAGLKDPSGLIDDVASALLFTRTPEFCRRLQETVDMMLQTLPPTPTPTPRPDEPPVALRTARLLRDLRGSTRP